MCDFFDSWFLGSCGIWNLICKLQKGLMAEQGEHGVGFFLSTKFYIEVIIF